ncbi:leucyl aminopeptidase [Candidatus Erwinia haradaeae]|uniref:Probable cytosol aminopeptidase n=1 Tax=Candidatus Erwinia haradaeae TaxID=1922217 RepID=A0A803GDC2_9GAMM|nr:leucyl aminopeptidase [Candidatus Erwinia haradaeae]VFP88769.1 Cytosol aminopeptidase [Candidatus Erwinia haradaeae]
MEFNIKITSIEKQRDNSSIVIAIFESRQLSPTAEHLDKISNGYLSSLLRHDALEGKIGQSLLLYNVPNVLSKRILLIGCGKQNEMDLQKYRKIMHTIITKLNDSGSMEAVLFLIEPNLSEEKVYWSIRQLIESAHETLYSFNQFKQRSSTTQPILRKITFNVSGQNQWTASIEAIQHSLAIAKGIKIAKDLGNMPPNICNSSYLTLLANQLATTYNNYITTHIINEKEMDSLSMNAYLAVGSGSKNESLMSIIKYKGHLDTNARPIVLVGKGVTFDSGGVSLKPGKNMHHMKYDMCGAAAVYAIMNIIADLKLPLNVIGVLASCENMPGSRAYRPGDILTTMSGQTVEVLNTDAEGRLILCEALTYINRFNPEIVIDIATLTGACVIALGNHMSGLLSNYDPLVNELITASKQANDHVWHLPISKTYQKQIDSKFADIANIGEGEAGAITAACFLARFTKKYHWAHLDIAGTAWDSKNNTGATGRPVALLSQFLLNRSHLKIKSLTKI